MKLIEFSVNNYRSITKANKIVIKDLTVLVGKNNEGKSNLLTALNVAMETMSRRSAVRIVGNRSRNRLYDWERDFPIHIQSQKNGLKSIFKLTFNLDEEELSEFKRETGIRGNSDIHISIKYGKDTPYPEITIPKKGTNSYTKKSDQILDFVSKRISFNYIQAVRTEEMALEVLNDVIKSELRCLDEDDDYLGAVKKINKLQNEVLDNIANNLKEPLRVFLPQLESVTIKNNQERFRYNLRNDIDIMINDGNETNINYKGDGIKSLLTLAILKDRPQIAPISIIAIEEPESHLHSGAIHSLVDIINNISAKNQVILTTHNPLFVQQNNLKSNIIVDRGTAEPAKSIAEIRSILGVLPSDNLRNANNVLVVEGEDDKLTLSKIISVQSPRLKKALDNNQLVIKSLGGASNLSHTLNDLKNSMCKYFVLLDNDAEAKNAIEKSKNNNLIKDNQFKYVICNGQKESELEDCLKKELYNNMIKDKFSVDIKCKEFKTNNKWSLRMKNSFMDQGSPWNDEVEKKVKLLVAEKVAQCDLSMEQILIKEKSGFINATIKALENMISNKE